MSIGIRKFGWLRTPSAWQQAETWRARRASFVESSISASDIVNATFAQAATDQGKGLAKLATQAAVKRVQAEAKSKIDATIAGIDSVKLDMKI